MPTQLKSKCPQCGAVVRANESLMGKRVRCPTCKEQFELTLVQFGPNTASLEQAPQAHETIVPGSSDTSRSPDLYPPSQRARNSTELGKLGRFELRELLGQGAFGRVYKAYDPQLDRFVAIKVPSFGPEDKQKLKRFVAEAKAAARLRHPNIVPVFDSGSDQERLFIASAFIEGQTLADRIDADRPDFRESVRLVIALASGLDCAHGQGVIHRDVKPANIMLDSQGMPLLMDFGLAHIRESGDKLTHDGSVLGTPAYMSPEQAAGKLEEVGPASDQYSLGVIFYELLTGKQPFSGVAAVVISQVISQYPALPTATDSTIPRELEAICLKAMSKNASKRYASCQAFADDLSRWLASKSIQVRPPNQAWHFLKGVELQPRRIAIVTATVLLLAVAAFGVFLFERNKSRAPGMSSPTLDKAAAPSPEDLGQPSVQGFVDKELLVNPGCDEGTVWGRIPGWAALSSGWHPAKGHMPRDGSAFFRPGASEDAELRQDVSLGAVNISASQPLKYIFSGYVRSYDQEKPDSARIIIECRDANEQPLDVFNSGPYFSVKGWRQISASRAIPIGTETIRVRLLAHRNGARGSKNNDGWFDSLSLRLALN